MASLSSEAPLPSDTDPGTSEPRPQAKRQRKFFFNLNPERPKRSSGRKRSSDDNQKVPETDSDAEDKKGKKVKKTGPSATNRHLTFVSAMQEFSKNGGDIRQLRPPVDAKRSPQAINQGMISSQKVGSAPKVTPQFKQTTNIPFRNPVPDGNVCLKPAKDEKDELPETLKMFDEKLIRLVESEIMVHELNTNWNDIAGLESAKTVLKEVVVWPFLRPEIFHGIRAPPRGLLLFGPPGTGKTMIASQCSATFFNISASSLTSKWVGEGEKLVRALFAVARTKLPAFIFIDEVDSLLSSRSDSEHESSRRIKTEFLVQLDGLGTEQDERLLVLGATNRPQELDEAARRRFTKRLYIGLPETEARKQMVEHLMKNQKHSLESEQLQEIALKTEGYSGADMRNLCAEAAYGPLRSLQESIETVSPDQIPPISFDDFISALQVVRPTIVQNDLVVYETWNQQFGCARR